MVLYIKTILSHPIQEEIDFLAVETQDLLRKQKYTLPAKRLLVMTKYLLEVTQHGDWFTTNEWNDAYLHINKEQEMLDSSPASG